MTTRIGKICILYGFVMACNILLASFVNGSEEDAVDLAAYFIDGPETPREPKRLSVQGSALLAEAKPTSDPATMQGGARGDVNVDVRRISIRAGLFLLGMCTVCGVTMLFGRGQRQGADRRLQTELGVAGSLAVSPGIGLKVVQVGRQRIVIGYDRGGMRSMLVLPESFTSIMDETEMEPRSLNLPRDSYRPALAHVLSNPKDSGWDLNHKIPSR